MGYQPGTRSRVREEERRMEAMAKLREVNRQLQAAYRGIWEINALLAGPTLDDPATIVRLPRRDAA